MTNAELNIANLFSLPTNPEEFSVLLPPATLRKLDFSALDFPTSRKALIEYIQTYFPDDFNDFVTNNGVIMLVELCSYLLAVLSLREDILANEAFLPTCQSENAVINHLALIGQKINGATPASTDVQCSLAAPLAADLHISPGTTQPFQIRGEDGSIIYYEIFSAPDDLTSDIIIPAGKQGVIAFGLEGQTLTSTQTLSGAPNTTISIQNTSILESPITVTVQLGVNGPVTTWTQVDNLQTSSATDQVFEATLLSGQLNIQFGDNVNGKIPLANSVATVVYRVGGGIRGRIGSGVLNVQRAIPPQYPYTAPIMVTFTNLQASSGGTDRESLSSAKVRGPADFATQGAAVTEADYAVLAGSFSHPVFGAVSKAVATVRTGLNTNRVEIYVLASGPNDIPVQPSQGLKKALATYLDDINVITDSVMVLGGCIHPVDISMTVVMSKNADASVVKTNVESAIGQFFDLSNWNMGQPLYISQLIDLVTNVDGVTYVDLQAPVDNVLPSNELCVPAQAGTGSGTYVQNSDMVAINEVITLGTQEISYYYERVNR